MVSAEQLTMVRDLIADLPVAADPQLSSDGAWVAWMAGPPTKADDHFTGSVWLAPTDGLTPPRRLTAAGKHRDHHPRWSPSEGTIAFLSDRHDRGTDAVMCISVDGGEAEPLVRRERSIETFAWSPDGRRIAFVAPDEPDEEDQRRERERDDADVYGERWPYARLYLVDIDDGGVTALPSGDRNVTGIAWSPDGTSIGFVAAPTPELDSGAQAEIYRLDVRSGAVRRLCAAPDAHWLTWLSDGRLLWTGCRSGHRRAALATWSVAEDGGEPRMVTRRDDVCEVQVQPVAGGDGAVVAVAEGMATWLRWDDDEKLGYDAPGAEIRGLAVAHPTGSAPVLAVVRSRGDQPPELWAGSPESLRQISEHQASWHGLELGRQRPFEWTAPDGLRLDGLVHVPPRHPGGPLPAVVLVHGGPYARCTTGFHVYPLHWAQWLALHGYAVLEPNYRGGAGRGDEFAVAARSGVGGDEFGDVMSMVDAAVARGIADPDRLGIGGWSQGGFMTAWAITQTDRFKAGVMGAGVSDWGGLTMNTDMPVFESQLCGGTPWDGPGPHEWARRSPISFASQASTPLLILHGEQDRRIPVGQAVGFARALRQYGCPVRQVVYPREGHAVAERQHVLDVHDRVRDWFARWL
ncbi:S9 family peptidase [Phytoactinopolyspora mesophila]|uniref:Prolyl oligopeptidase family serine peptidase n=1 Tax=Phytoactinopolyspora mesophila TaxID=2650750 RepID=A0A7K3M5T7_9ACTN|nr:S9 family peptidase [Phytoactinopolyspora mesophila]NDL58689.1 prolyl oligopeptidase family serine peptidase [Phytoactinopolyspora mesophila]